MSNKPFEIKGLDAMDRKMIDIVTKQYPKEANRQLRKLSTMTLRLARQNTNKLTGVVTGNLKKGWSKGRVTKSKKTDSLYIQVRNKAPHAHLLEKGHNITKVKSGPVFGFVPGRKMLANAIKTMESKFPAEMRKWMDKLFKEWKP